MTVTLLVALFYIEGRWVMHLEFGPLYQDSTTICELNLPSADAFLERQGLPPHHVLCLETTPETSSEDLENYIHKNLVEQV